MATRLIGPEIVAVSPSARPRIVTGITFPRRAPCATLEQPRRAKKAVYQPKYHHSASGPRCAAGVHRKSAIADQQKIASPQNHIRQRFLRGAASMTPVAQNGAA